MEENKFIKDCNTGTVNIPRDYLRGPIFASKKQTEGRIVKLKKYDRTYEIGGFEPLPCNDKPCPALDIRHGRALFAILTFYEGDSKNKIRFSLNQFSRRYANSNGGRYTKDIQLILNDLIKCWFRVTYPDRRQSTYRILKDVSIHSKLSKRNFLEQESLQREFWLDEVELHPEFYKLLSDYAEIGQINLKILTSIRSPLAQSIYTYMPSRIVDRLEENAFEISLTKLLQEVGHTVPDSKWLRRQLFIQNEKPILEQLNGLVFSKGTLKVKLIETESGDDYKLLFWNGKINNKKQREWETIAPKFRNYWLKSGRTSEKFNDRLKKTPSCLSNYQEELLEKAQVQILGNEVCLRMAIALLGEEKFNELASEVKGIALESGDNYSKTIKNPTKVLISLICKTLAAVI